MMKMKITTINVEINSEFNYCSVKKTVALLIQLANTNVMKTTNRI